MVFEATLAVGALVVALAIYLLAIKPLSSPPTPPPDGVRLAMAGQQVRNYGLGLYVAAPDCDQPVTVVVDLYLSPLRRRFVKRPGWIALALTGSTPVRGLAVYQSSLPILIAGLLTGQPPTQAKTLEVVPGSDPPYGAQTFRVRYDPREIAHLTFSFEADWLHQRTGDSSCWLTIPALRGGDDASLSANRALGHEEWASVAALGLPIVNGFAQVNEGGIETVLQASAADSIPQPTRIDPTFYSCGPPNAEGQNCQASVALSRPGSEASRARQLTLWSILIGLVLALLGDAAITLARRAFGVHGSS